MTISAGERPLLLATIGTDHHPFDRLISWVDSWLAAGGDQQVRALVQHSTSPAPAHGQSCAYLNSKELHDALDEATVVVCHAGATIMETRRTGLVPIVVARDPALGEVVDSHQLRFAQHLADNDLIVSCTTETELHAALDRALACPEEFLVDHTGRRRGVDAPAPAGVQRAGALIDELVRRRRTSGTERSARARRPARTFAATSDGASSRPGVTVLLVGGSGRSGSTLVERVLGELPGVCAAGELTHLWERGLVGNERCGCGEQFHSCAFWGKVGDVAFGGWSSLDAQQVLRLRGSVDRMRFIPELAMPSRRAALQRAAEEYASLYSRLYNAIAEVSGNSVVIDSSKRASQAFTLRLAAMGVDLRLLHMVRDSRGVAHSWAKSVRRPEAIDSDEYMPVYSPTRAAVLWNLENGLVHGLERLGVPTRRLRYEDFLDDPRKSVRSIAAFVGVTLSDADTDYVSAHRVRLTEAHTVAGNPMRFLTGELALRRDEDWRRGMSAGSRRTVSALTLPLQARYGYARSEQK